MTPVTRGPDAMECLTFTLTADEIRTIKPYAQRASLGGTSHVRNSDDRNANLSIDQIVGQVGEFTLARFMGDESKYFSRRDEIDKNPWQGDDGFDYPGSDIDVKTSFMRGSSDPMNYRLAVRPRERRDKRYILALVKKLENNEVLVTFAGWAYDSDLPKNPESSGIFQGAYTIMAPNLRDMSSFER